MVASAMDDTMTMPVAAEKPPTYAISASALRPSASGRASTIESSATLPPVPNRVTPAVAIGSTMPEISTR